MILFSVNLCLSQTDFRKTTWGMTKEQIKQSEHPRTVIDETDEVVMYETKLADFKIYPTYIFTGGKLTRGKYILNEKHSNKNDYINDYNKLKRLLIKKYGKTKVKKDVYWKNDLYKDDPQHWGTAISIGHLVYHCGWETPKTKIVLMLWGENYKLSTVIEYKSVELESYENKFREKTALDDF